MKKKNNALGKIAIATAAIGLGTYIYKKFIKKNCEDDGDLDSGVVETEDLDDNCCENDKENKDESEKNTGCCCGDSSDETDSSFEIKLYNLNKEDTTPDEDKQE